MNISIKRKTCTLSKSYTHALIYGLKVGTNAGRFPLFHEDLLCEQFQLEELKCSHFTWWWAKGTRPEVANIISAHTLCSSAGNQCKTQVTSSAGRPECCIYYVYISKCVAWQRRTWGVGGCSRRLWFGCNEGEGWEQERQEWVSPLRIHNK